MICLRKALCIILCLITALGCAAVFPVAAADKTGKIHNFVPEAEEFYPGVEDYIAAALREHKESINVAKFGVTLNNIIYVFKSTVFDNPDIFYVDASIINYKYNNATNRVEIITPTYLCSKSKQASMTKKFNKAVKSFVSGIDPSWSDFTKALILHDRIAVNCTYKDDGLFSFTAYSALVTGRSLCEGYSRAYSYLLSLVGVDSKIINNDSKRHCWNCVKIGNSWYHIDVTSDDPTPDTCGFVQHKYFLCTDSRLLSISNGYHKGFLGDATFNDDYSCTSSKYNTVFARSVTSQIVYADKSYYFINNNYKGKHQSALIRRKNGSNKVLKLITDKWYYKNKYAYEDSFSKLGVKGNSIYFNTKRSVYRYNLSTKKFKRLHTLPSFRTKSFYGITVNGNYAYATRYNSMMKKKETTKLIKFTKNKPLVIPYRQYTSMNMEKKSKFKFTIYGGSGKVRYKTSSKKIATVNKKGVITARKKGKCTVTAVKNGYKFKLKVSVR